MGPSGPQVRVPHDAETLTSKPDTRLDRDTQSGTGEGPGRPDTVGEWPLGCVPLPSGSGTQSSEAGDAGSGPGCPGDPGIKPGKVHRGGGEEVLKAGLGMAAASGPPQAEGADTLVKRWPRCPVGAGRGSTWLCSRGGAAFRQRFGRRLAGIDGRQNSWVWEAPSLAVVVVSLSRGVLLRPHRKDGAGSPPPAGKVSGAWMPAALGPRRALHRTTGPCSGPLR